MQVFLPSADFSVCASVLDDLRLGNQCYRECLTLFNGGWRHHPAAKMWAPHRGLLAWYALALAEELSKRKRFSAHTASKWQAFWLLAATELPEPDAPSWLHDTNLHRSHQSNLVRKDPEHYRRFWPDVPDDLDYIWPVE